MDRGRGQQNGMDGGRVGETAAAGSGAKINYDNGRNKDAIRGHSCDVSLLHLMWIERVFLMSLLCIVLDSPSNKIPKFKLQLQLGCVNLPSWVLWTE